MGKSFAPTMAMVRAASPISQPPSKMHPRIAALAAGKPPSAGKVEVQVWLTALSNQALDALKRVGLEILRPASSVNVMLVIGRIRVEKLAELAKLDVVRYIAPLE
jgi:hypothetical protein